MGAKVYDDGAGLQPQESSFLSQYWCSLKVAVFLRFSQPGKNIFEMILPVLFIILISVIYSLSGGLGDQLPPVEFVGDNAALPLWSFNTSFCIDASFTGSIPTNLPGPLQVCTSPCGDACHISPEVGCKSVMVPGLCSMTVNPAVVCSDSSWRPAPFQIPSLDVFVLSQEVHAEDIEFPQGLVAITGDSDLFSNGAPIAALRDLIDQLNRSHASFDALFRESGPWRTARGQHAELTDVGDADGLGAMPGYLLFAKPSDAMEYVRDHEGAVLGMLHFERLDLGSPVSVNVNPLDDEACDAQPELRYRIRLNYTEGTVVTNFDKRERLDILDASCSYARSGFLSLQHAIEAAFVRMVAADRGTAPPPMVAIPAAMVGLGANMPLSSRYDSLVMMLMASMSDLIFLISFILSVQNVVSLFVTERESGTRESCLVMGARRSVLYAANGTVIGVMGIITAVLCALGMTLGFFKSVTFVPLFLVFLGFAWSVSTFSFLMSMFFRQSRSASTAAPLIYLAIILLHLMLKQTDKNLATGLLFWLMMTPFSTLLQWFVPAAQRDLTVSLGDFLSASAVIGPLIQIFVLAGLYALIGIYLDHVLPTAAAAPLHPLFFVMPSYWCPDRQPLADGGQNARDSNGNYTADDEEKAAAVTPSGFRGGFIEALPAELRDSVRVRLQALGRTFGSGATAFKAVDKLSLEMCEGQITILLGHNGAGKTTTVSMLTGLLPVSSGDAIVYGHSIVRNMTTVRNSIGLCPQKNVIWPALSVRTHLDYYATVKGVPRSDRAAAVESLAVRLGLADKIDAKAGGLSGGQKRKLCVAMALIGGSKVVFLDEPTAGMDVQARLAMWEMLQEVKKDRVVIMSTHYMDEAEQLGDRVALMSQGKLHSCGTPLFLKQRLGVGYHLAVSMVEAESKGGAPSSPLDGSPRDAAGDTAAGRKKTMGVDPVIAARAAAAAAEVTRRKAEVVALIRQYIGGAEIVSDVGGELSLRLPMTAVGAFSPLFDALDGAKEKIGIRSYAISPTTLEEVFLHVAHDIDEEDKTVDQDAADCDDGVAPANHISLTTGNPDGSAVDQIGPLIMKRVHMSRRDRKLICMTILMPFIFSVICAALMQIKPPSGRNLELSLDSDGNSEVLIARRAAGGAVAADAYAFASDGFRVLDLETAAVVGAGGLAANPSAPRLDVNTSAEVSGWLLDHYNAHGKIFREVAVVFGDTMFASNASNVAPRGAGGTPLTTQMTAPFTIFANTTAYHSVAAGMSLVMNGALNATLGGTLCSAATTAYNHPLPLSRWMLRVLNEVMRFFTSLLLVSPFLILPAGYAAAMVKERETKAKHLQYISGASSWVFWLTAFVVDLVTYAAAVAVALASYAIFYWCGLDFAKSYVYSAGAFFTVALSFALYGMAVIPCVYAISPLFSTHSSANNLLSTIGICIGFLLNFGILVLRNFVDWWEVIEIIFRLTPHYNIGNAMLYIAISSMRDDGNMWDIHDDAPVVKPILALIVMTPVFWAILLLGETSLFSRFRAWISCGGAPVGGSDPATLARAPENEDSDVAAEREAVLGDTRPLDRLRVTDMVKIFPGAGGKKEKIAVRGVTFGVRPDEVFAFLGTNGAGKTTTMSILCGEFDPSHGSGYVDGYDVVKERDMARRNMGYCPQFDAVLDNLNSDEHLQLYGALRGLDKEAITRDSETLIKTLGLIPHRRKPAGTLSGGNKRKLSIALALIGAPAVIFLDEPSAGLDPVARRALWDALGAFTRGCSVVLTTHHLEEVEALAQRVAIMVDGRLVCMGPLSHLKAKFGRGFEVQVSCATEAETVTCSHHLITMYPGASIVAADGSRRTIEIARDAATLGAIFRSVEALKHQYPSLDFSVGQTSLEQVFVRVSKETEETAAAAAYARKTGASGPAGAPHGDATADPQVQPASAVAPSNAVRSNAAPSSAYPPLYHPLGPSSGVVSNGYPNGYNGPQSRYPAGPAPVSGGVFAEHRPTTFVDGAPPLPPPPPHRYDALDEV